jgi:hypothetical protein
VSLARSASFLSLIVSYCLPHLSTFDAFGEAVVESLVKCSIIPLNVRGQLSEIDHVAIDMVGVEHFELSNSSLRCLDDVCLAEQTIEFVAEYSPTAPNRRLGVESKKGLPPDQGNVAEVGCCIGDKLPFFLEFLRLVVEDHDTAGDEHSEKPWFLAGEFVRFRSIGVTIGDSLRVSEWILKVRIPGESGLRPGSSTRRWCRRARRSGGPC